MDAGAPGHWVAGGSRLSGLSAEGPDGGPGSSLTRSTVSLHLPASAHGDAPGRTLPGAFPCAEAEGFEPSMGG